MRRVTESDDIPAAREEFVAEDGSGRERAVYEDGVPLTGLSFSICLGCLIFRDSIISNAESCMFGFKIGEMMEFAENTVLVFSIVDSG